MEYIRDTFDLAKYLEKQNDDYRLDSPTKNMASVVDMFYGEKKDEGDLLPWPKTHKLIKFRPGEVTVWCGINGHGKALSLDTPIPTVTGWSRMGDLRIGDQVFDENGTPCNIVAATEVMLGRPCYEVEFSDGTKIIADAEHEWLTDTAQSRQSMRNAVKNGRAGMLDGQAFKRTGPAVRTTFQIAQTLTVSEGCWSGLIEHSVDVCGPLECRDADLPIEPYTLGAWLGDGNSNGAVITTPDDEVLDGIAGTGVTITKHKAEYRYGLTGGLQTQLRISGLLNNKHVPSVYLRASPRQRLALLQGLMDSDGYVDQRGTCEFSSTRQGLADAVAELAQSFGIIVKVAAGRAKLYGRDCGPKWRVMFTTSLPVFTITRKLQRLKSSLSNRAKQRFIVACRSVESVPVRCIQVDSASHLYLASKSFIPTHNSMITSQVMLELAWAGCKPTIASMEMLPRRTLWRMVRQASGYSEPSIQYIKQFIGWLDRKLYLFDHHGTVSGQLILGAVRSSALAYGSKHFVIDSLMKTCKGEDDYNGQKDFVDEACAIARDTGIHIHIIHHVRKGENEFVMPGKFDGKGSGAIADQVDNWITVFRNKRKEAVLAADPVNAKALNEPDCILNCDKQRNGEYEGRIGLWFDRPSMSYVEHRDAPVKKIEFELESVCERPVEPVVIAA